MAYKVAKWDIGDLSQAMDNAISQYTHLRFLKRHGNTIKFNGFWRNGDKQNVCTWLDKAAWHDAKTGEGGGCKEFAKIAFNMSLPEFMDRFGSNQRLDLAKAFNTPPPRVKNIRLAKPVCEIFKELKQKENSIHWLENKRGFIDPAFYIGSGFADLSEQHIRLFEPKHHTLIRQRLSLAKQMIVPLRGIHSDEVKNLFFRSIEDCPKEEKSRLLTDAGGYQEEDGSPRAFGFPHLIHDFPNLVLCEGMADYFSAEFLLGADEKFLPIGAPGAKSIIKWATWLSKTNYLGKIHLIYQLDTDHEGGLAVYGPGQKNAVEAKRILSTTGLSVNLFNWTFFLQHIPNWQKAPGDLADVFVCADVEQDLLSNIFINTLGKG